jgi:peptidoglycan/xylan/chitin deacetylase (PgdA/CDA1 family)
VLELLERHEVTATFLIWGRQAQGHPEVVREVLRAGRSL